MRAISLFSGAGGMDVGFKNAGYKVIGANEFDTHACKTFQANHPETALFEGDIADHIDNLAQFNNIDVVFGGPPCQGFSVAGRMDQNDPRSKLIFRYADAIDAIRPMAFVMENVKALGMLEKFADVRKELMTRFYKAGYSSSMHILNAKDFGVPQARERVFFIGFKNDNKKIMQKDFRRYYSVPPSLREAIIHLGRAGSTNNRRICNAKVTLAAKPILRKSPYAGMMFNGQGRPLNPDGWASTLPASMGGNRTPIIDESHLYDNDSSWVERYHSHLMNGGQPYEMFEAPPNLRRLTMDEAILLQGFPAEYQFHGSTSRIFNQIGNAVPCKLAEVVAKVVKNALNPFSELVQSPLELGENYEMELTF